MMHGFFTIIREFPLFEHGFIKTGKNNEVIFYRDDIPLYRDYKPQQPRTTFGTDIDLQHRPRQKSQDRRKSDWLAKFLLL